MSLPQFSQRDQSLRVLVVVRFSSASHTDLTLPLVRLSDLSIGWIRRNVRSELSDLSNKRLRFIVSGKVLNNKTNLKEEYFRFLKFNNNLNLKDVEGDTSNHENNEQDKRFYIHCLIGDELTPDELQKENELDERVQEQSTTPAPVGFDRLASAGFSQEDINALREQFGQLYGDLPTNGNDEDNRDIRQLEERWINSSVNEMDEFNNGNIPSSPFGGNEDLLIGILIGCLLGVLSLFLLKIDGLFSKKQRMAIVAGFMVNFSFALLRQWS